MVLVLAELAALALAGVVIFLALPGLPPFFWASRFFAALYPLWQASLTARVACVLMATTAAFARKFSIWFPPLG
jgi:hypothetical protein